MDVQGNRQKSNQYERLGGKNGTSVLTLVAPKDNASFEWGRYTLYASEQYI